MSDIRGANSESISEGRAERIDKAMAHQRRRKPDKDHPDTPPGKPEKEKALE